MLTLRELQAAFYRSVTADVAEELLTLIAGDGFDPASRLAVYGNNVWSRLTDALHAAYPVVCELVDRRFFEYAVDAFVREHPPVGGCLGEYGGDFPEFLAEFPPAGGLAYLPDVARLEWIVHELRRAARPAPASIADLGRATGDPSRLRFHLSPAVRFITSPHAIDQIWIAHQSESPWQPLRLGSAQAHLQVSALDHLNIVSLTASTWEFRARMAEGQDLGTAAAMAIEVSRDFDLESALAALFAEGVVVGVSSGSVCSPPP